MQHARIAFRPYSLHRTQIFLRHPPRGECLVQGTQAGIAERDQQKTGAVLIQTMGGRRHERSGKMRGKPCAETILMPAAGMCGQAGRLVRHQKIRYARDHLRRGKYSPFVRFCRMQGKGRNPDGVSGLKAVKGAYPRHVTPHLAGAYPTMQRGGGKIQSARQKLQQLLPGFRRIDFKQRRPGGYAIMLHAFAVTP